MVAPVFSGVSRIDLALHVVERYYGREVAQATADFMEYKGELREVYTCHTYVFPAQLTNAPNQTQ